MRHVEPNVFLIAKTAPDHPEMRNWLDFIGASEFALPPAEAATIGNLLIALAGKRCYMSYQPGLNPNVSKVRTDLAAFIDNILKVGHGSVIEHVNYTFAIENVSRVFTAEFNRHRAGLAVSEGSMRYIRFDDLAYWIPESIRDSEDDSPELREAKQKTRAVFNKAFTQMEENYQALLDIWDYESLKQFKEKKKLTSLFRRLIGMGVATGGVWTGNLRALRHIFTMRCDPAAEEEICYVASMMLERMIEAEPDVFGDFHKEDGYWKPKYMKV
ncbi:FAD-dependent thymidylate synthase [Anaerolineales bacterium HSG6]|nr:FAD-dependent thymidylate synthase [Anaerolineales bacterium HSG6]MDM8529522.1 FAD-dependent thymidylate synthase [Anaerolineales bacterium HSG25]